jgi:glyoxylase I family protein
LKEKNQKMIKNAKYVHTNLIAKDWKKLSEFYKTVFGCVFVPPERDYSGQALEAGTGVLNATLRGVHLKLPGSEATLEIYSYSIEEGGPSPAVNRPGFGHIAFEVEKVLDAQAEVIAAGGKPIGEIVTLTTTTGNRINWCYVADPEGNIIELQSWNKK